MTFGLSSKSWNLIMELAVKPFQAAGCEVWVFGSRARGDHNPFSDIDLLYEGKTPLSLSLLGRIRTDLEDSDLPIKVDFVDIKELASTYLEQALAERKKIR